MSDLFDGDITPQLVERLRSIPGVVTIDEAWFAKPLDDLGAETPAILPYLAGDDGSEVMDLRQTQRLSQTYGIWIICPRAQFRRMRQDVRNALKSWAPSERHEPMFYSGGRLEEVTGPLTWWREQWETAAHISARS